MPPGLWLQHQPPPRWIVATGRQIDSELKQFAAAGDMERIQDLPIKERINRSLDAFWIETCL